MNPVTGKLIWVLHHIDSAVKPRRLPNQKQKQKSENKSQHSRVCAWPPDCLLRLLRTRWRDRPRPVEFYRVTGRAVVDCCSRKVEEGGGDASGLPPRLIRRQPQLTFATKERTPQHLAINRYPPPPSCNAAGLQGCEEASKCPRGPSNVSYQSFCETCPEFPGGEFDHKIPSSQVPAS